MNLFRSEEDTRRWEKFNPEFEYTLKPMSVWAEIFSSEMFRNRRRSDYISWLRSEEGKRSTEATMARLQKP